jgi:mannose-1-phosphate guanylyltransferase
MPRVAVMVLAAGLGTRLAPLSAWVAKPLVPVGDRPALAHVLERARGFGGPIVVNAHHHASQVAAFLERERDNISISHEKELLGTAGGVHRALDKLGSQDVLVWNADILAPLDVAGLRERHERGEGVGGDHGGGAARATLVVSAAPDRGNVGVDALGRVVRLRQETVREGEVRGVNFLGVQVIGRSLCAWLPPRGGLIEGFYLPLLARDVEVRVWETTASWHDIGTVTSYLAANVAWLRERGVPSWRAHDTDVASGVTLASSVVGEGARVTGDGQLDGCVVWPGARAVAPLRNAVVTPFGVVQGLTSEPPNGPLG